LICIKVKTVCAVFIATEFLFKELAMSTSGNMLYYNTLRKYPAMSWDTAGDITEMSKSSVALRGITLSQ